jgi:hypothetical protein
MVSMSRPVVVWWWLLFLLVLFLLVLFLLVGAGWCRRRGSYGVSPTTPPIETAPTIGLWRVLSLRHFRPARSGSYRLAREHRAARRQQSDPLAPAIGCQLKHHRQRSRTETAKEIGPR